MVNTYAPTYYSSLQDTITSLCKSILPFSLKNRSLTSKSDRKLAKRQSDNLKWQQESFHGILNLIGLLKEGIVAESDVSAFRSHLLDTLIASPADQEPPSVIRDKLLFLQELLHAKCISAEDYHSSKRPLLQRLAVQGIEIDCRDVIVGAPTSSEEEWSVIELNEKDSPTRKNKAKHRSPIKSLIGNAAFPYKPWKGKGKKDAVNSTRGPLGSVDLNRPSNVIDPSEPFRGNPFSEKDRNSENCWILKPESSPPAPSKAEKVKRKPFHALFQKERREGNGNEDPISGPENDVPKYEKKLWRLNGFKKSKSSNREDESTTPYLLPGERSDDVSSISSCTLVTSPIGQGPDTKRIKRKIHSDGSASDFFIDKVLGENIKKELSRIQSELCATNPNLNFSDDQIEAISTRLPVDKGDLKNFFPKSWCDRYGDIVLDVVRKEFKDHVGEMETLRNAAREKRGSSENWVAFEENDENFHPNLFLCDQQSLNQGTNPANGMPKDNFYNGGNSNCFVNNPFHDDQNPFWTPRGG